MTNTTEAALREFNGIIERWPGYAEQSWSERFAELDRRHTELKTRMYQEITRYGGIATDVSQPPASSTAGEPESDWELEQRAFAYANDLKLSANVRDFIKELWKAYCDASSGEPASVAVEVADMLRTAKELRDNSNGNPGAIREAIMWEKYAAALSKPTPVEAGLREALEDMMSLADDAIARLDAHDREMVDGAAIFQNARAELSASSLDASACADRAGRTPPQAPAGLGHAATIPSAEKDA